MKLAHLTAAILIAASTTGCARYYKLTDFQTGKITYATTRGEIMKDLTTGEHIHVGNTTTIKRVTREEALASTKIGPKVTE